MPAHSSSFPWPSYYGHFDFFEARMHQHRCVLRVKKLDNNVYELGLSAGSVLRVFICECYSYGAAEYVETIQKLGKFDVIIINSAWCGYTTEAKKMCRAEKVGLFKIGDLMSALNMPKVWEYLNNSEEEVFAKNGWL